jgi:hypothetical protein
MPWNSSDAKRHNKRAGKSKKRSKQWSAVANSVLEKTGDEGRAVRTANGVVRKSGKRKKSRSSGRR